MAIFAAPKVPDYSASCTEEQTIGMPAEWTEMGAEMRQVAKGTGHATSVGRERYDASDSTAGCMPEGWNTF